MHHYINLMKIKMGSYLSEPVTEKVSCDKSNNKLICGASSMQGWRVSQQDAHNCILDYDTNTSYFAVYDGHMGHEVALYCSENLPQFLKEMEAYKNGNIKEALEEGFLQFDATITTPRIVKHLKKLAIEKLNEKSDEIVTFSDSDDDLNTQPEENRCLNESGNNSIRKTEDPLCDGTDKIVNSPIIVKNEAEESSKDKADIDMCDVPGYNSGCTAIVVLLRENELYVANAGDSRCILCRNGKAIQMSFDHKPRNDEECERIINAGGRVIDGRVNCGLNLSRAIGDHAYKQNTKLSNREQMITALPDVRTFTICPEDEYMFLASDGIWDCMSNETVVYIISTLMKQGKEKLSEICELMFVKCVALSPDDRKGRDNMTAIIVQFKPHQVKRPAEEVDNNKRLKTEESVDTTVV